jgi:hypothetical protein
MTTWYTIYEYVIEHRGSEARMKLIGKVENANGHEEK